MASSDRLGDQDAGGGDAPDSGFRRQRPPMIASATIGESWSISATAPAQATPSVANYITPDAVLRVPGVTDVDGLHAGGVQGCLWPPDLPVASSHDMDTPASEIHTHAADIDDGIVLRVGMQFPTIKAAYTFYRRYARVVKFGIKKYREAKGIKWMNCVREGKCKPKLKKGKRVRKKTTKRCGCKAGIKLRKVYAEDQSLCHVVIDYINHNHNHNFLPSPSGTKNFHCNRELDPTYLEYIGGLQASRVPEHCIMDHMAELHDGVENVPLTCKDLANMKAARAREDQLDDVARLMTFFTKCKQENPKFYCDYQLGNDGKIVSIFWSYASMQGEYADFGDAVTFDTTHKTNLYQKPLALFVGANHHLQCTVFGIALLGDDTTETFQWVFNTFKTCMGGKAPKCILTDQDPAMPDAIRVVFPDSIHRLCLWHVLNKYQPLLNELYARFTKQDFKEKFCSVIHHPLTPAEFEAAWSLLVSEFELQADPSLNALYDIRADWVPCYFKGGYSGIMSSTQRSESVNHIIKKCHVDANTPLHMFAKQMIKFIHRRKMSEATEEYGCTSETVTDSNWPFEVGVGRVYTRTVFNRFEESMKKATAYRIAADPERGMNSWLVQHTKTSKKLVWGQHQFKVMVDTERELFKCECRVLEQTGLFCVHLLRAFMHVQLERIPSQYVLQRYCRNAHNELPFDRADRKLKGRDGETKAYRHDLVLTKAMKLVRYACLSKPALDRSMEGLDELIGIVSALQPDIGVADIDIDEDEDIDTQEAANTCSEQPQQDAAAQCDNGADLNRQQERGGVAHHRARWVRMVAIIVTSWVSLMAAITRGVVSHRSLL